MVKQERGNSPGEFNLGLTQEAAHLIAELRPVTVDTFPSEQWFSRVGELIETMLSAAQRDKVDAQGARHLLALSRMSAELGDLDIVFDSINILSRSKGTVKPLLEFAERELRQKRYRDWRWIGFYAIGAVLANKSSEVAENVSGNFLELLWEEAPRESDSRRRGQLIEMALEVENIVKPQESKLPQNA